MSNDDPQKLMEALLSELFSQQSQNNNPLATNTKNSYLEAGDGQFLGEITNNKYLQSSILNEYGPYGSKYSPTSIFNQYCPYGGVYGQWSAQNPYCGNPPKLYIGGRLLGFISENKFVQNRIPFDGFIYALRNKLNDLMQGRLIRSEKEAHIANKDSFIIAQDDTFLGKLNTNRLDNQSIFSTLGPYGNRISPHSIFNTLGKYGSGFSQFSPFNIYSRTPPEIYISGKFRGYLTKNVSIKNRVDPSELEEWVKKNVPFKIS